ncbi:secondary thiamine-phosphate synthase enzyme YjbQ [Sulfurimonas sp. HSL-1716]|uniref:secondary thiamine-phosphate synthase enzyme YjbQ n=1 Tax=Hydrocurvibacter sulfurireducens TaxID=3131937 RepID=UPI0031F7C0F8
MRFIQIEIKLRPRPRGFHIITDEILQAIDLTEIKVGMLNIFLKHTSASLSINENCEREVRSDMENLFSDLCDEKPYFKHTYEGEDDMPAHAKSSLLGVSLNIPITEGRLNLGTWQGIYLGEHRENAGSRSIVLTASGI